MSAPAPQSCFLINIPTNTRTLSGPPEHPPPESLEQIHQENMGIADDSKVDSGEDHNTHFKMDSVSQELDNMVDFLCSGSPEFRLGAGATNQSRTGYIDCVHHLCLAKHCFATKCVCSLPSLLYCVIYFPVWPFCLFSRLLIHACALLTLFARQLLSDCSCSWFSPAVFWYFCYLVYF